MFRIYNSVRLWIVFFGLFYSCQSTFAQRAVSATERNADVQEINQLYNSGKWEEGKNRAEANLKKNPKDADMRMVLGKYFMHKQQYDKARYELAKSIEYAPANVESKQMLVTVETETQRYSSAICYINELLEVNPYWKGLWRKKIELYRTMGNHVEADRLLKRISQIYPEDEELKKDQTYLVEQKAVNVKKTGKIDELIDMAKKVVEDKPQQQDGYLLAIDNFIKAGDYNNALVYTERALNQFPGNGGFVQKKIAILEHQQRYPEILVFLEAQMKGGGGAMRSQYNYFLLEAARSAKNNDPATLYGKIFDGAPGNKEAFDYVFNDFLAKDQLEASLLALNKHRKAVGTNKELDMKELMVVKRTQDQGRIEALTRTYFAKYPADVELKESYVNMTVQRAKANVQEGKIGDGITEWKEVLKHGDEESVAMAQRGLYNAYVVEKRYQEAIMILDDMLLDQPGNSDLMLKKSDLYDKQDRYEQALRIYEQVIQASSMQDRERLVGGYNEMIQPRLKALRDSYRLVEAKQLGERWLLVDERNQDALLAMINISYQMKDKEQMLHYAQMAEEQYGDDVSFKVKLAEAMLNQKNDNFERSWTLLHEQIQLNPYHVPLVKTFINATEEYAGKLLKEKSNTVAVKLLDTALRYEDNKTLKYMKGLAYEGLKNYDSAYYYQRFHDPSIMEYEDFKSHLNYLSHKTFKNVIGLAHLRARFGDDYSITSISTVDYTRLMARGGSYTGRLNYAGRGDGKGIQGQAEWSNPWTDDIVTRVDLALANKYFAQLAVNLATIYTFKPTWDAEVGVGYRRFFTKQNLMNLNLGITKDIDDFRLAAKLSNFYLTDNDKSHYLYSVGLKGQYFMGNPLNYLLAVGSVGNSPDIDLVNSQLYSGYNVMNAMVGAGIGRSITRNMNASLMGTWYNFQVDKPMEFGTYRNLYNLYFQLNVSF